MSPACITPVDICTILATGRFTLGVEKATQAEMELHLTARLPLGVQIEREKRLSAFDVPDFLIDGRIVVEVKVRKATRPQILRQLTRYAGFSCVEALILASSKGFTLPSLIGGKPAFTLSLSRAWL